MTHSPSPIDKYIGDRVRVRRHGIGMSQEQLGQALGLTEQQVQKYEAGTNRIGSSRLQQISDILGVPVSFFFANSLDELQTPPTAQSNFEAILNTPYGPRLLKAFASVRDTDMQRKLVELIESALNLRDGSGRLLG